MRMGTALGLLLEGESMNKVCSKQHAGSPDCQSLSSSHESGAEPLSALHSCFADPHEWLAPGDHFVPYAAEASWP
jgi:hypothetical protein